MLTAYAIDPQARDLTADAIGPDGRLRVLPASYWQGTTKAERALFGHRHGLYGFPTVELVEFLRQVIDGRSAIEIGAGAGVLADALGIPGTDNRQMERPEIRRAYELNSQPLTKYGPNVEKLDAHKAVRKYKPQVVIAQWVTQRYDPQRPDRGGNQDGPDLARVIRDSGECFVFIGNELVHRYSPVFDMQLELLPSHPAVYSRAVNGTPDFIALAGKYKLP